MIENRLASMQGPLMQENMFGQQPMNNFSHQEMNDPHDLDMEFENPMETEEENPNIIWSIDSQDIKDLSDSIWKKTEKEERTLDDYMKKVSFILELCGLDIPSPNVTSNKGGSAGDNYIKNSGTAGLYSSAMSETIFSITSIIKSVFFGKEYICDVETKGPWSSHGGQVDPAFVQDLVDRLKKFYNSWFKNVIENFEDDFLTTIMWSAVLGKAYRKSYFDPKRGFPTSSFIPPGMILTNDTFNKFYEDKEITHKYYLSRKEIQLKIDEGEWHPDILNESGGDYEKDTYELSERLQSMQGKNMYQSTGDQSDDGELIIIYERHMDADIGNGFEPYVITYGKQGGIGSLVENFDKNDPLKLAISHFTKYSFLSSFDGDGLGIANYGGQNARAATVLERRTIDSSIAAVSPPAFAKPTAKFQNHNITMEPGKITTLATGDDDISKAITFAPVSTPNPIMWQLKTDLEDSIKKLSHIVSDEMIDLATRAPQGSVLAILGRMEQLPNAILQSYYNSFQKELNIFKRMFFDFFKSTNEPFTLNIEGEMLHVFKQDFSPFTSVCPTGNFSSESTAYKMMRAEIVLNQARQNPDIHNMRNVMTNFYKDVGLDKEIIAYLMPDPAANQPQVLPLDPLTENSNLLTNKPVKAALEQDHDAHILIHQQILQTTQDPNIIAATNAHIQEHQAMKMLVHLQTISGVQLPPDPSQIPIEMQNQIAIQVAQALMQQQQHQQAGQPPMPIDPGMVGLEEVKAQKEIAELNAHVKMKQIEADSHNSETKMMLELSKLELAKEKEMRESIKAEFELKIKEQELYLAQKELELDHSHKEIQSLKHIVDIGREEKEKIEEII